MKVYELIQELSRYDADTEVIILKPAHDYRMHQDVTHNIRIGEARMIGTPESVREDWLEKGGDSYPEDDEELVDVVVLS
jgi:hypothetical protein